LYNILILKKEDFMKKIILCLFLFINFAFGADVDKTKFIQDVSTNTAKILSGKNADAEFNKYVDTILDTEWIAKFVLGANARTLKKEQINEFKGVYKKYLIQNYASKLKDYNKDLKVIKTEDKANGITILNTTVRDNMNKVVNVDFRVSSRNGKILINDIIPEGISFVGSQRTDIGDSIKQQGFDNFMKDLRNKVK
jgi:ABC-type transporter MlaC component